jgi:mycothione reductase
MITYDLVVVGSGAGLNVLSEGLEAGMSCALVENEKFGGTCLTRGCIPSKILIRPADIIREAERAARLGLAFPRPALDWDALAARMWRKIAESDDIEKSLIPVRNLTVHRGTGEFTGPGRMRVRLNDGSGLSGEFGGRRFVLATGARSIVPHIDGLDQAGFVTTESFFGSKFPQGPWKSLIIVGGGLIAAEFGHLFSAFGTKVTILEALPRLLPSEEPEVSAFVAGVFRSTMDVRLNSRAVAAGLTAGGRKTVTAKDETTGRLFEVEGDEILVAAGRRSNADLLKPEATGVKLDARGWIEANAFLETSAPGVWALGDALGMFQFRHKANADAEVCARNLFRPKGGKAAVDISAVPWAVYTHPQVGHVGLTEQQAVEAGHEVLVAVQHYSQIARGYAMGYDRGDGDDGFVKLVVDRSGRILGVHVVGPEAGILVQPFVYLMNAGFTCPPPRPSSPPFRKDVMSCPEAGSIEPIYRSMVIHPSLNELTAWAIGLLQPSSWRKPQGKTSGL